MYQILLAFDGYLLNDSHRMKSTSPQIENLKQMIVLEERRANLESDLAEVDSQLETLRGRLTSGSPISQSRASNSSAATEAPKAASKGAKRGPKAGRGELKSQIFTALEKAGSSGVKVMDLAKSLGSKPANIYAWFHAAVKRYPNIKKVGNAQYRLAGSAPASKAAAEKPAGRPGRPAGSGRPAATAGRGKGKRGGGRRGALREKILAALKQAGSSGVRIKDLANDLDVPNRNLQVWFATTGKKTPGVKKIAPGTFKITG
jgi:hypothetical protein